MITHSDEGPDFDPYDPDFDPDDPLTVILRPPSSTYLGPPPGHFEAIRRGAFRRLMLRTAAGAGLVCAVAALIALPLRLTAPDKPTTPTAPMAPPSPASPTPASPAPTAVPTTTSPDPSDPATPSP
ncbi:hypothetical protein, partial [Streptomyces griseus]|uniref:hypothetical protein n=1 Tax=Streptomyces griseus TaxID=1911 RepID=UPI00055C0C68